MKKKVLLGCGIPLLVFIALTVVGVRTFLKPKPKQERSETVTRGDVEIKVVETGSIEPLRKVEVKSKVGGRIAKLLVDEGAVVQQGQVLALIDPQEINSQVAALQAQLSAVQARLASARKNADYQRWQTTTTIQQYSQNLLSSKSRMSQAAAEANVQPQLTSQSIEMAQANLTSAKASLEAQQKSLQLMIDSTHPQAIVNAESAFDQARVQAVNEERNLARQKMLMERGFASQRDVDAAETAYEAARSNLRQAKERLERIRQTNSLEEANLRAQIASAQGQVSQMAAALGQAKASVLPDIKQQELQSARASYAQANAQLAAAKSGKLQDKMRLDEVASAEADVRQIQNQLNERIVLQQDTTIRAPMSGVITKRYVEAGELVTSGIGSFSSGTPIFQVGDLKTMLVKININEVDIPKVQRDLPVEITLDSSRGTIFTGRVYKVAPSAYTATTGGGGGGEGGGGGGGGSQTVIRFPVQIKADNADPRLKPGMSARCAIIVSRQRGVLRLPNNCITGEGAKGTVQIVTAVTKDGVKTEKTTARDVTIGLRGDEFIELTSGVSEGEKVRPAAYTGPPRKAIEMKNGPG